MKTNENFQLSTFNFQPDKRLAVVILNWNGRALMEEFLPSVVACTPGEWADVIVADNGSTDDSIEMLKTKFPTVGIIRLDKNYGFAEGYNQALKHIGHEYTVLLNSDVEVTPGWLDAPIAALDADKTIAGVQPKIRAQRNKEYFEYAVGIHIRPEGLPLPQASAGDQWSPLQNKSSPCTFMQDELWLGRRGSNSRMRESKSRALPLGDDPL